MCVCVCVCVSECKQQVFIKTFLVNDNVLFPFLNLQVMTLESSCYFSYVWLKIVNKEPPISRIAFDQFPDHPQEFWWIVCYCELYSYLCGVVFFVLVFFFKWGLFILLGLEVWLVIKYVFIYINNCIEFYFIYCIFFIFQLLLFRRFGNGFYDHFHI